MVFLEVSCVMSPKLAERKKRQHWLKFMFMPCTYSLQKSIIAAMWAVVIENHLIYYIQSPDTTTFSAAGCSKKRCKLGWNSNKPLKDQTKCKNVLC